MALMEKNKGTVRSVGGAHSSQAHAETPEADPPASAAAEGQDEQAWEAAIASSLDVIRDMADRARAERQAGRTNKTCSF